MFTLSLALLAVVPSDSALPAPIYCPFAENRSTVLMPDNRPAKLPTNASVWVAENVNVFGDPVEIVDLTDGSTVATEEIRIITNRGALVQIRPLSSLRPNHDYEVKNAVPRFETGVPARFSTGSDRDEDAPAAPIVVDAFGSAPACQSWGLTVRVESVGAEQLLLLAGSPDDDTVLSHSDQGSSIHIPVPVDQSVTYELVAIDIAGNRSAKTAPRSDIAAYDEGGCTCVGARRGTTGAFALLVGLAGLGLARRRR